MSQQPASKKKPVQSFLQSLGPGVVAGAADDDPSGIATYSMAGAQLGVALLWTALLTWPLMCAVQIMCARIGMVRGQGLAGALRKKFPKPVLIIATFALFAANTINIGADLMGMADAGEMLTGISAHWLAPLLGIGIAAATVFCRYAQIAGILKWLALVLFAYVITGFIVHPDWAFIAKHTFLPGWPRDSETWGMLVAILGTTISPYLFFWQSSQEVEEEKVRGRRTLSSRRGALPEEILNRKLDVGVGTFMSNLVMYFIILTTALVLNRNGIKNIETSKQAAEALRPMAGHFAFLLYTVGILGVGLLAIPTLSGSAAYALAETFGWRQGLDEPVRRSRPFYAVVIVSMLLAIALNLLKFSPIKALYWSAVLNGLLAPFLLVGILIVARDSKLMEGQPSSKIALSIVTITTLLMLGAAIGMFVF